MNKEYVKPNYSECITNLANSIMKYFQLETYHNGIREVDKILNKKNPKNVIVILYDGMGKNILERCLTSGDFFIKNMVKGFSSVSPATTTAATTSMLSGMNPSEHGWLGWDLYFKDINKVVTMFLNTIKDTKIKACNYNIAEKVFPYPNIIDKINSRGQFYSKKLFPFGEEHYKDIDDMMHNIIYECKNNSQRKYIYAYYEDPDSTMHKYGANSKEAFEKIRMLNEKTEALCEQLRDAVVIVVADHGHKDCKGILLSDYKDFYKLLDSDIWIEGRFCSFKVKKECEKEFRRLFKRYFENDFILKTRNEIIDEKILGDGVNNKLLEESIGDFVALGVTDKYFRYCNDSINFKSMHAGFTEDEMIIPLIIVSK